MPSSTGSNRQRALSLVKRLTSARYPQHDILDNFAAFFQADSGSVRAPPDVFVPQREHPPVFLDFIQHLRPKRHPVRAALFSRKSHSTPCEESRSCNPFRGASTACGCRRNLGGACSQARVLHFRQQHPQGTCHQPDSPLAEQQGHTRPMGAWVTTS